MSSTFFTAFSGSAIDSSSTTAGLFGQTKKKKGFAQKPSGLFGTPTSGAPGTGCGEEIKCDATTCSTSELAVCSLFLVLHSLNVANHRGRALVAEVGGYNF